MAKNTVELWVEDECIGTEEILGPVEGLSLREVKVLLGVDATLDCRLLRGPSHVKVYSVAAAEELQELGSIWAEDIDL